MMMIHVRHSKSDGPFVATSRIITISDRVCNIIIITSSYMYAHYYCYYYDYYYDYNYCHDTSYHCDPSVATPTPQPP